MSRVTRPAKRTHERHRRLSPRRLKELIEQAIVDACGPAEQAIGFHATLEQELALPFDTIVLGVTVSVRSTRVIAIRKAASSTPCLICVSRQAAIRSQLRGADARSPCNSVT
jgi:hypothetical protein